MITGQILEVNGIPNLSCYPSNLPIGSVNCEGGANNAKFQQLEWATPVSKDGLTVSGFQYDKATDSTPLYADSFKVVLVLEGQGLGSYKKVVIPNDWDISDLIAACCAGCDPIDAVTVPDPIINGLVQCVAPAETCPACVYTYVLDVPALTGSNDTFTATPSGTNVAGTAISFSPTTVSAATLSALATAAQAAWATELGSGTFAASGTTLTVTGTNIGTLSIAVVQSDAP